MNDRLDKIEQRQDELNNKIDNHIVHIVEDLTGVKVKVEVLMKVMWLVATASVGSFLAALFSVFNGS